MILVLSFQSRLQVRFTSSILFSNFNNNLLFLCFEIYFYFIGKYYLVDAGYPLIKGFLGPYKGERYHLPVFRSSGQPNGYQEVFNHAHSSLRSVIERTFGVWKKKWKVLRDMPSYPFGKQVKIVIATMSLHNFIRKYANYDLDFEDTTEDNITIDDDHDGNEDGEGQDNSGTLEMKILRDQIAASLMGQ